MLSQGESDAASYRARRATSLPTNPDDEALKSQNKTHSLSKLDELQNILDNLEVKDLVDENDHDHDTQYFDPLEGMLVASSDGKVIAAQFAETKSDA